MNIHMVHSFKGGCGKTTVALSLAAELSQNKEKREKKKVILVDMDLKGSGLEATIYQGDLKKQTGPEATAPLRWQGKRYKEQIIISIKKGKYYLTDYFTNWHYREQSISQGDCIWHLEFSTFSVDMMVASMEQRKKRMLYIGNESGGLELDLFRYRFERLLYYLNSHEYTDIVLDMPPSSDEYVEEVNRVLFPANKTNTRPWMVNLYYITTTDTSNLVATGEYLNYLFFRQNESMARSLPDYTIIVLNDLYSRVQTFMNGYEPNTKNLHMLIKNKKFSELNSLFDNLKKSIYSGVANVSEDNNVKKLQFVFVPYNVEFQKEMSNYLHSNATFLSLDALRNLPEGEGSDSFTWDKTHQPPSIAPIPEKTLKEQPEEHSASLFECYFDNNTNINI